MGIIKYAQKKLLKKAGQVATLVVARKAVDHVDKKTQMNMLQTKAGGAKKGAAKEEALSSKSFFEEPSVYTLTMVEKTFSIRKSYTIKDTHGNVLYTAKHEGLPKLPEIRLYNASDIEIGCAKKEWVGKLSVGDPRYSLYYNNKKIASLYQKQSLKVKYHIPENGWIVERGVTTTTAYDSAGAVSVQIQRLLLESKDSFLIEYTNKENEVPAVLLALVAAMYSS